MSSQESIVDKVKRYSNNCAQSTLLCCFKAKEQSQIAILEQQIASRKGKFGVEYVNLVEKKASEEERKACLSQALTDINALQAKINEHYDAMDEKEADAKKKIIVPAGAASAEASNENRKKPVIELPSGGTPAVASPEKESTPVASS
jgi:hypothetical protein